MGLARMAGRAGGALRVPGHLFFLRRELIPVRINNMKVLYEDNHLIAIYKPAGVLVQKGDRPGLDDNTLYWQVKMFLKERDKKPGNVFLGILHRLDRNVSGVVLFAKTSKGAARLSEQIREREISKTYHAVVVGQPKPDHGTLRNFISKDQIVRKAMISDSGDEAILHYETVRSNDNYSLLKIKLETGRFHQIRIQLSEMGNPIVGDTKYLPIGRQAVHLPDNSLALCATELRFITATTNEPVSISIPYPSEWDMFIK